MKPRPSSNAVWPALAAPARSVLPDLSEKRSSLYSPSLLPLACDTSCIREAVFTRLSVVVDSVVLIWVMKSHSIPAMFHLDYRSVNSLPIEGVEGPLVFNSGRLT